MEVITCLLLDTVALFVTHGSHYMPFIGHCGPICDSWKSLHAFLLDTVALFVTHGSHYMHFIGHCGPICDTWKSLRAFYRTLWPYL